MNKGIKVFIWIILDIMLFIVLLFSSLQFVVYNDAYFEWHYKQHDIEAITQINLDNLMEVTDKMMEYLIDQRETLDMTTMVDGQEEEVFGEREKAHMVDVKSLFLKGKQLRDISFVGLILILVYFSRTKKDTLIGWLNQLTRFFVVSFALIGVFGGIIATDFNKYFTIFHELFFNNDLWLLDPETDILVNMVPEIFFFQTVMLILLLFVLSIMLSLVIARSVRNRLKRI